MKRRMERNGLAWIWIVERKNAVGYFNTFDLRKREDIFPPLLNLNS